MKVLVANDEKIHRQLLAHAAQLSLEVDELQDADSLLRLLPAIDEPVLLVMDWERTDMSGVELLSAIRRLKRAHSVHVIAVTGMGAGENLKKALAAGTDDYLLKPFHANDLLARIHIARHSLLLHEQLTRAKRKTEGQPVEDSLTELLNLRGLVHALRRERRRALRNNTPVSLVEFDVDCCTRINDDYGYGTGDEVLRLVARALRVCSRGSDLVARKGGDEFILVLPESNARGALACAKRIQEWIRERTQMRTIPISVSFAIAEVNIEQNEECALAAVDAALHAARTARQAGGDQCAIA